MPDNLADDFQLPAPPKVERPQKGEAADFMLPGYEAPDVQKDWGEASWGDVLSSGVRNLPSSAMHQLTAIPEAIMHPGQTLEGIKMLGRGAMSKAGIGGSTDADQRRQDEAVFNAMVAPFTSVAGLKKSLATDPFEVLSVAGMALSGGASGAGKIASTLAESGSKGAQLAGKAVGLGAKGLEGLSYAADPTKAVLGTAGYVGKNIVAPAVGKGIETVSGVNAPTIKKSFEAGFTRDPALKEGFNQYASGSGRAVDLSQDASNAFEKLRKMEFDDWKTKKGNLESLQNEVDFEPALKKIEEARKDLGPVEGAVGEQVKNAHKVLDNIEEQIRFRQSLPAGDPLRTVEGVDQLKRSLWKDLQATSGGAADAYRQGWAGIRESLSRSGGEAYNSLMKKWNEIDDGLENVRKTLGTGNKVAANAELTKLIKSLGDVYGSKELERLAAIDPTLPYKIAGASLNAAIGHPTTWDRNLSLLNMGHLGVALASGDVPWMVKAAGSLLAQKLLFNPEVVGKVPYYVGAAAGSPVGKAATAAADVAGAARPAVTSGLMQLQNVQTEETGEQPPFSVRPGTEYRMGRATGGRIMDHEAISDRLVRQAEQIKKEVSNHTEKLLNTPDDHVAKALEIANRHI